MRVTELANGRVKPLAKPDLELNRSKSVCVGIHELPPGGASFRLQPQVHELIASILAQIDVVDYMSSRFMSEVHEDFMERLEAGELDSEPKRPELLAAWAAELLSVFFLIWLILRFFGCGSLIARRLA